MSRLDIAAAISEEFEMPEIDALEIYDEWYTEETEEEY